MIPGQSAAPTRYGVHSSHGCRARTARPPTVGSHAQVGEVDVLERPAGRSGVEAASGTDDRAARGAGREGGNRCDRPRPRSARHPAWGGGCWCSARPWGYAAVTVIHPRQFAGGGATMYADLRGQAGTWLAVQTVQIALVMLLGATIWALVDDLEGTAAKVARLAILPFVAFYSAFDAIVGFATGLLVRQAEALPGPAQAVAP